MDQATFLRGLGAELAECFDFSSFRKIVGENHAEVIGLNKTQLNS